MSTGSKDHQLPKLCLVCKDMYGNPSFAHMCSKCFRESKGKEAKVEVKPSIISNSSSLSSFLEVKKEEKVKRETNLEGVAKEKVEEGGQNKTVKEIEKCLTCKRRTGPLGYSCKHCSSNYCKMHRLPEDHECQVDLVGIAKRKLAEENPVVCHSKIQHI